MRLERDATVDPGTHLPVCPTDDLVDRVHRQLARDGGFTVDSRTGHRARSGFAVCADPGATLSFARRDWERTVVARWVEAHRHHGSGRHVGGWCDPRTGRVVLDVVHVLPYAAAALARSLGRAHRQQAIFDLGARRLVCLDEGTAS